MRDVRKANREQDRFEKTDAIVTESNGEELRIQIKLGFIQPDKRAHYFSRGIVIVQVDPKWSELFIRYKTLDAIESYKRFVERETYRERDPLSLLAELEQLT